MIHSFLGNPRIRLIVLVIILLIPALGLIYYTTSKGWRQEKAQARVHALGVVKIAAAKHEQLIESTRQVLVALSHLPEIQTVDSFRMRIAVSRASGRVSFLRDWSGGR